ncbi:CocE/NonD family hydrolase [Bosea sp. AS-1]|uniref:CocE/NonD family hydrolase n=1 Tax=Bosea sp. AS-1 TaxID=2015316 RepID=UPI0020C03E05|nr:CocE/NonD family hydrolase [Bosea sp. AS-1]
MNANSPTAGDAPKLLRDVMVTMRDGIRLATDVYLPVHGEGPFHAILERTPYGKRLASRSELMLGSERPMSRAEVAAAFCAAGYAVVFQDCRGRYGSEGEFTKYLSEAPDGYDTIQWIAGQPWCTGKVGTMGLSYAAHTQLAAACLAPPALAGMILDSGGFSNAYRCGIRQGGAFELKQATWAYNRAQEGRACAENPELRAALAAESIIDWFGRMPWSRGNSPIRWEPEYESYLLEQWQNGSFNDYWKALGIYAAGYYDRIPDIPVLLMSSWYDVYVPTTFENLAGLSRGHHRPELVMGPWTHGNRTERVFGDVDFGPSAPFDGNIGESWLQFRIACFDRWLKGGASASETPVRLFVMGGGTGRKTEAGFLDHGGHWIEAANWPPPQAHETAFHLHANGTLSMAGPATAEDALTYDFDPRDPVPTIGGALTSGQPVFEGGAFDQREDLRFFGCRTPGLPLSSRPDVLMFETEPLATDLTIVGPVTLHLWVSSDAPDTDFTAKLIDVHPPSADYPTGFAMNLSDGIFRCRYRHSWESPKMIGSGEVFEIVIELFATANLFKAGHRIRLDVSSSNFPKFDVNPNTGAPEGQGRAKNIARNTVHFGRETPSRLLVHAMRTV